MGIIYVGITVHLRCQVVDRHHCVQGLGLCLCKSKNCVCESVGSAGQTKNWILLSSVTVPMELKPQPPVTEGIVRAVGGLSKSQGSRGL